MVLRTSLSMASAKILFAKNLSSNSINVSTLRGEGELSNLELNEKVLTDLLELPNWIQITGASVNKVSIKIQWTKLKSTPIVLSLDEVRVQMGTCSELRSSDAHSDFSTYISGTKYGFVDKVIDGMTVIINSVHVIFNSPAFSTSFQISRIVLCSKSPSWLPVDLRMTRLKDLNQQHVLIFKELSWYTLKIESRSEDPRMTPLRLITNQSCCRMTVKKKLSDCSVVGCRLVLLSDDILWVLTDSQLLSAYHLIESLSGLIKRSTEQSQKAKAARKLESSTSYLAHPLNNLGTLGPNNSGSENDKMGMWNSSYSPNHGLVDQSSMQKFQIFKKFDVVETSYHFYSEKIDLHFCDDPGDGRSSHPELKDGGTLQLVLKKIKIDYYPYHLADGDRTHWIRYQEGAPYQWTKAALSHFKTNLIDFFNSNKSSHTPLGRASPHTSPKIPQHNEETRGTQSSSFPSKSFVNNQYKRLMSSCCLLTCGDIIIYKVALSKRKCMESEMLTCDKSRLSLPEGTSLLLLEFSSFYYPGGFNFPVPAPKIYTHVSPLKIVFDSTSCLWLNAFACQLMEKTSKAAPVPPYIDVYMEVLMPRIVVEPLLTAEKRKGRPKVLQILTSKFILSNVRSPDPTNPGSKSALFTCLEEAQKGQLFFASGFPSEDQDKQPIPPKFLRHAEGADSIRRFCFEHCSTEMKGNYSSETLWTEAKDIIFFCFEPLWMEFLDKTSSKHSVTFVDPFPLTIWVHIKELSIELQTICPVYCNCSSNLNQNSVNFLNDSQIKKPSEDNEGCRENASLHIIVYAPHLVCVQFSHLQFLFLMRLLDTFTEFTTFLTQDTKDILKREEDSFLIAAIFPGINLSMIIPPAPPTVSKLIMTESLIEPLHELTLISNVEDNRTSSPSDPSLSPPSFSEESKEIGISIAKSQSDGCLIAVSTTAVISNNLDFPEAPGISKSGEELNASFKSQESSRNTTPIVIYKKKEIPPAYEKTMSGISSSMKRGLTSGFNSFMNTIDSSVKIPDDSSDTVSVHSDISNDSDNFVLLYLENEHEHCNVTGAECVFKVDSKLCQSPVEAAAEVMEEVMSSEPSEFSHCIHNKEFIGVVSFRIGNIQFTYEGEEHDSILKFISTTLVVVEIPRISLEEFQSKFNNKNQDNVSQEYDSKSCLIKLRLCTTGQRQSSEALLLESWNVGQASPMSKTGDSKMENRLLERYTCQLPVQKLTRLDGSISGASLSILMSSVSGIANLVEDELFPEPFPMKIKLENIEVTITEKKCTDEVKFSEVSRKILIPKLSIIIDANSDLTLLPLYLLPSFDSTSQNLNDQESDLTLSSKRKSRADDELKKELEHTKQELERYKKENANLSKLLALLQEKETE